MNVPSSCVCVRVQWEFGGLPDDYVGSLYEKWNPARFVKNMKTPTLVIHSQVRRSRLWTLVLTSVLVA